MPPFFWTQKQDIGPSSRTSHGLAYDAAKQRVVLFGGDPGGSPFADTWQWDGELWTQVEDIGPSARHSVGMAFDAARQRVVLFGGTAVGQLLGDTWSWDGESWTQVADTGPDARSGPALAYDPGRERIVLFGGLADGGSVDDTWEWDGTEWTQLQDVGPSARSRHAMTYDVTGSRVLLFGGARPNGAGLGDTWSWDGSAWEQVADTGPEPRAGAGMVSAGANVVLFGGINSIDEFLSPADRIVYGDSWRWDGTAWTKVQDIGPAARWGHAVAFRSQAGRLLLFGGSTVFGPAENASLQVGVRRDTWEHLETGSEPGPGPDPGPGPPGVEVDSVIVTPGGVSQPGDVLDVSVMLTGNAPDGGITLSAYVFFDQGDGNFQQVDPPGFTYPTPISVGGGDNLAQFQMTRTTDLLNPGGYAVAVGVDGGSVVQGGFFSVS